MSRRVTLALLALVVSACAAAVVARTAAPEALQPAGELTNMKPGGGGGGGGGGFDSDTVDEKTGAHLASLKQFLQQNKGPGDQVPLEDMAKETYKPEIRTWNYANGGLEWEEGMCAVGKQQSPILLDPKAVNASLSVGDHDSSHYLMRFNYTVHEGMSMLFNGHTLAVTGDLGWVETGCCHRERYEVLSFHFHSPAGHVIQRGNESWRAPLEMRIVHQRVGAEGKSGLMMVSILFEVDPKKKHQPSTFLQQVDWDAAPDKIGVQHHIAAGVDLNLLRDSFNGDFLVYNGSLATPTCDEGVEWRIMDTTAHLSEHQVDVVRSLLVRQQSTAHNPVHGNVRNLQPRNGRAVVHYHRTHDTCHTHIVKEAGHCCRQHCCPTKLNPCAGPPGQIQAHPGFIMP